MRLLFVLAFVVALTLSVALHEAGHLLTAKHYGMKAREYFVGFGPRIWSFQRGETEYGLKAIPAGGYVKIAGMTQLEELADDEQDRAFWRFPARPRAVVLSAGSMVHFAIAIVLVMLSLAIGGDVNDPQTTLQVQSVLTCVPSSTTSAACPATVPAQDRSPATLAGLEPGDVLVRIDGTAVSTFTQAEDIIRTRAGKRTPLVVRRDGHLVALSVTPVAHREQVSATQSIVVGFIGFAPGSHVPHYAPLPLLHHTADTLGEFVTGTVSGLGHLPSEITRLVEGKPRGATSIAGVIDLGNISGQIGVAAGVSFAQKVASFLILIAELNLFVGIFNLLPLLPLDGGHIAILLFEAVRSRLARLLRRPDPGRVDIMKVLPVAYAVIVVFVGLSLLLVYAGIANPIKLQ